MVIYLVAIPLAFVRSWLACALYVLVAVMWFAGLRSHCSLKHGYYTDRFAKYPGR